jgi:O-acetyl-ADP-ribose deacetylase (regulator of RNase III)
MEIIQGDLLTSGEKYIAHQCNCISIGARGLAKNIADKWKYADVYTQRKGHSKPGTIVLTSPDNPSEEYTPHVICMFAQFQPGKPNMYNDSPRQRLTWFKQCLEEIVKLGIDTVAMPHNIGCGLAGGDWKEYQKVLEESKLKIKLYKID